jgi:methylenetetrahydrofolate dehydrogenase (NADP+)/methenyltetrahydrofolate cyclohydrolase
VRNKVKACQDHGLRSVLEKLRRHACPKPTLLARIAALNADPSIHGILVQMPVPKHIDPQKVIAAIAPPRTSTASRCRAPAR